MPPSPRVASDTTLDPKDLFAPLRHVEQARRGPGAYYPLVFDSSDEIVRLGACCHLLTHRALTPSRYDAVLEMCRHPAIRERAFEFFQSAMLQDYARRVVETPVESTDEIRASHMQAELLGDHVQRVASAAALFRVTGDTRELLRAALSAEHVGGWRVAAVWLVRAIAIAPVDPMPVIAFHEIMCQANQFDLVAELNRILERARLHPFLVGVYGAHVLYGRGDVKGCLTKLNGLQMPSDAAPQALRRAKSHALWLAGEANDKLADFAAAYRCYSEMNRLDVVPGVDGKRLFETIRSDTQISIPKLTVGTRDDVVMLLGFIRSGTTLLELVLDSHPDIEAFEESPTWDTAMAHLRLRLPSTSSDKSRETPFEAARDIYYSEIDRRRRKPSASLIIDKFPLRSIHARTLSRILPDQKYLFSIRHPFDVVLSALRQRFEVNVAMENFHSFKDAVEIYDFTMNQWFGVHGLDDPLVHYVRYDRLVNQFEETTAAVLSFLGVKWDDDVRGFADAADTRASATPSYQKIRKGLSIGVQTSWRNYGFLFQSPEAKPLHRWAEHFGFETK